MFFPFLFFANPKVVKVGFCEIYYTTLEFNSQYLFQKGFPWASWTSQSLTLEKQICEYVSAVLLVFVRCTLMPCVSWVRDVFSLGQR